MTARPRAKLRIVFVLSVLILVLGLRPFGAATPLDLAATLLATAAWQSTFALAAWALSGESRICVDREGITVVQRRRFRLVRQACTWPEVCATKYRVYRGGSDFEVNTPRGLVFRLAPERYVSQKDLDGLVHAVNDHTRHLGYRWEPRQGLLDRAVRGRYQRLPVQEARRGAGTVVGCGSSSGNAP